MVYCDVQVHGLYPGVLGLLPPPFFSNTESAEGVVSLFSQDATVNPTVINSANTNNRNLLFVFMVLY